MRKLSWLKMHCTLNKQQINTLKGKKKKELQQEEQTIQVTCFQLEEDSKEKNPTKDTKDVVTCVTCAKKHDLEQCKTNLSKFVDERSKYLSTKELCYGWLKPISKTHTTRNRNHCQTYKACSKKHPMSQYGFKAIVNLLSYKKVALFLHKCTHHTIPCKKNYFFLSIYTFFVLQYHFRFCFTLAGRGCLILFNWRLVYVRNSKENISMKYGL